MANENIAQARSEKARSKKLALTLSAGALCSTIAVQPALATEPPAGYQAVVGKEIWYAPHAGCLDRLRTRGGNGASSGWLRHYPDRETALRIREVVQIDGRWMYRFDWVDNRASGGVTPVDQVLSDTRFEALPTTFYKTCFFLASPQALAGYLTAEYPQDLERYEMPSAAKRQSEIASIEARDRRSAQ